MSNKPIPNLAPLIYTSIYPKLVEVARNNGYALAIHGSIVSDFDLIACAWTEDAIDPDEFISKLASVCTDLKFTDKYNFCKSNKVHNRVAYTIPINAEPCLYLDVSVYY